MSWQKGLGTAYFLDRAAGNGAGCARGLRCCQVWRPGCFHALDLLVFAVFGKESGPSGRKLVEEAVTWAGSEHSSKDWLLT